MESNCFEADNDIHLKIHYWTIDCLQIVKKMWRQITEVRIEQAWNDETLLNSKSQACALESWFGSFLVDFLSFSFSLTEVNYDSILKEILIGLGERDELRVSGFRKIDLSQLFRHVIAVANSDRRLQRLLVDLFYYTNARSRIILVFSEISQLEILSFVVRNAIFLSGREYSTRFISRGQYVELRRGGLSTASSSFLFSQNGAALCAWREI